MHFRIPTHWWIGAFIPFLACQTATENDTSDPLAFVNPRVGTGGHGHTYPGATVPFGMVQLSPDTRLEGWDGCSGYHDTDSIIYGFSHTHLSGTGIGDYLDVLLMPGVGEIHLDNGANGDPGYRSPFDKNSEIASPGYYQVQLEEDDILVELTATPRTGMHRYQFSEGTTEAHVILDLSHRDKLLSYSLNTAEGIITGSRVSKDWANEQHVFFALETSLPIQSMQWRTPEGVVGTEEKGLGDATVVALTFQLEATAELLVKVGLSATSEEGAAANLRAENDQWDFAVVRSQAERLWTEQLGKVKAEFDSREDKVNYYTALYHNSIVPNIWSDVDGKYRGMDDVIYEGDPNHPRYTVFSLWDTYRATHPFYTLTEPKRTVDFIRTFLGMYEEGGKLPMWELAGNYTGCMIGYHAAPVIADAFVKGIQDFDHELAMEAMVKTAETDELGKEYYIAMGYIPMNKEGESVSKTLEYGYDDWAIAQMAERLGKEDLAAEFTRRSQAYKHLFDPETGFMRGKQEHRWVRPFRPDEVNFNYTEANSWQYSFYVPHDVAGLASLHGGSEALGAKLDDLFSAESSLAGRQQPDITGLIGQYAHGNEPSHHMAYLYSFLGQAYKTQALVHQIMDEQYRNAPDGLSGNEDCGQMSAWYLFSALGFYPVTPGSDYYVFGSPRVSQASFEVASGKTVEVKVEGGGKDKPYIQSITWQGKPYTLTYIRHKDLLAGGELVFIMGSSPNQSFGAEPNSWPPSSIQEQLILPVPAISQGKRAFQFRDTIALNHPMPATEIYFTTDGSAPLDAEGNPVGNRYSLPFQMENSFTLKAVAVHAELGVSEVITAEFLKIPSDWTINHAISYSTQYTAGGNEALIDGLRGGADFKTGEWQGFHGVDVDATIDLGSTQARKAITTSFLQDQNSWIFMPTEVEVLVSADGTAWQSLGHQSPQAQPQQDGTILEELKYPVNGKSVRYVKVKAVNLGACPEWHKGAGGKAWIFTDEVVIQ